MDSNSLEPAALPDLTKEIVFPVPEETKLSKEQSFSLDLSDVKEKSDSVQDKSLINTDPFDPDLAKNATLRTSQYNTSNPDYLLIVNQNARDVLRKRTTHRFLNNSSDYALFNLQF